MLHVTTVGAREQAEMLQHVQHEHSLKVDGTHDMLRSDGETCFLPT